MKSKPRGSSEALAVTDEPYRKCNHLICHLYIRIRLSFEHSARDTLRNAACHHPEPEQIPVRIR